ANRRAAQHSHHQSQSSHDCLSSIAPNPQHRWRRAQRLFGITLPRMSLSPSARLQPEAGFFPFSVAAVSAKLLPGYAESGGYTERKKYRAQNKVIGNPGGACAE